MLVTFESISSTNILTIKKEEICSDVLETSIRIHSTISYESSPTSIDIQEDFIQIEMINMKNS